MKTRLFVCAVLTTAGVASADDTNGVTATAPATGSAWPQEMIKRPFTVNAAMIDVHAGLGVTNAGSTTAEGLTAGLAVGVSDKIELGVDYGIGLHEFEAEGPLTGHLGIRLLHDDKMSAAGVASVTYDLNSKAADVGVGVPFRYTITPQFAAYTPGHQLAIGIVRDDGGTGMDVPKPIVLSLPVGAAYQATPNIYAFAETNVANISISNSTTAVFGADFIPIIVGAFYSSSNKMDVGVALSDDLNHIGDAYAISVILRAFKI
jgi:hypothetical protein